MKSKRNIAFTHHAVAAQNPQTLIVQPFCCPAVDGDDVFAHPTLDGGRRQINDGINVGNPHPANDFEFTIQKSVDFRVFSSVPKQSQNDEQSQYTARSQSILKIGRRNGAPS